MYNSVYLILEIIGTVAFSISGAAVALRKKMDILGVIILGLCTSFGGGVLRDLILGITPPSVFQNPLYTCVSVASSLMLFIPNIRRILHRHNKLCETVLLVMDSIGLAVFTVIGIQCAVSTCHTKNTFLLLFVGAVTGVGGGVLRDVLSGETPYIFLKHFYACASIIGAAVCVILIKPLGLNLSSVIGGVLIVFLRIMAALFRWKLPKSKSVED